MKKEILSLAAVALLVAGCTKNENTDDPGRDPNVSSNHISIDPSTGKSKATGNDLAALKTTGFKVFATKDADTKTVHIDNKEYLWDTPSSAWKWKDTPAPVWPTTAAEYPMYFYSYYPANDGADITLTNVKMDREIVVKAEAKDQLDYLSSISGEVVTRPASGSIPLKFKHIMSKVNFKFMVGANMTAHIQSVKIFSVGNTGTYDFGTQTWTVAPSTYTSTYAYRTYNALAHADAASVAGDGTNAVELAAEQTDGGPFMLMPQATTPKWDASAWKTAAKAEMADGGWLPETGVLTAPTNAYIEVVYRLEETVGPKDLVGFANFTPEADKPGEGTTAGERYVKVAYVLNLNTADAGTAWATQTSYTYTIYLGTPDATNGTLIDHLYYYADGTRVTDNTNYHEVNGKPGDPVTPGDINFDVEVTPWTGESGDIK